jgi:uncharacterized membrane protein
MIFRQILNDLSGKDAYRGVTLTYTWMANQFGQLSSNENTLLENEKLLIDKNTIWVLGKDFENLNSWMQMLERFGVKRDNMFSINLDSEINN